MTDKAVFQEWSGHDAVNSFHVSIIGMDGQRTETVHLAQLKKEKDRNQYLAHWFV